MQNLYKQQRRRKMLRLAKTSIHQILLSFAPWQVVLLLMLACGGRAAAQTVGCSTPGFIKNVDYETGSFPRAVTTGDFNGDGYIDMAVANRRSNSVSVLLNNGSGVFSNAVNYAAGTFTVAVVTGDFNGDGKLDLAAANLSSYNVSVFLGNGDGTFSAAQNTGNIGNPGSLATGDFNKDGKPDLAETDFSNNFVGVLINNGNGSFTAPVYYHTGTGPDAVVTGDFNGDGTTDLAVANSNSNDISVLLNQSNSTFAAAVNYPSGNDPLGITTGYFDGDSQLDLAVANSGANNVAVFLNKGGGAFGTATNFQTGINPWAITASDFNADGKADLAVANYSGISVSVLLSNGDGTFAAQATFGTGSFPVSVTAGDFNGDNKADLATANDNSNTVSVLINTCDYDVTASTIYYVSLNGYDAGFGTSWTQPFRSVRHALEVAKSGSQIWVAKGTYYADEGPGLPKDRTSSFDLKNGVAIYGGFAGTESTLSERDWKTNVTTLSGDIDHVNNSDSTNIDFNSYHVVRASNGTGITAVLDGFTITGGNATAQAYDGSGGGMYINLTSFPTIRNCSFINNTAYVGGGMSNEYQCSPVITNCSFSGNKGIITGGGMYNNNGSSPTLTNCSFTNNSSQDGGGVNNSNSSSPSFINCSFAGNSSYTAGSAMDNHDDASGNGTVYSSPTLTNCILWGDAGVEINNGNSGNQPVIANSIVQGGCPVGAACSNVKNQDPLYVDAASGSVHLLLCSPGIDAGNDAANTTAKDLDGNPRKVRTIDLGAYEYQGTLTNVVLYVNAAAPAGGDGRSWSGAFQKLQDALRSTACGSVQQIWVAKGTYYPDEGNVLTDNDRTSSFVLKNGVAIYGGFAGTESSLSERDWKTNVTTLSGDIDQNDGPDFTNNDFNSYHVVRAGNGTGITAVLDGFTITGGNAYDGSGGPNLLGGGLYNDNASPALNNCIFLANKSGTNGAGVYNTSSSPTFTNCSFSGNKAGDSGGGMFNISSSPAISNCSFTGNLAFSAGGGILNTTGSSPALTNCNFVSNKADVGGGLRNYANSSPVFTNCSFTGNTADRDGGGIYNGSTCFSTLTNCIVWNNTGRELVNDVNSQSNVNYSIVKGGCPVGSSCSNVLNTDPLYVDTTSGNLHLQPCSPAVDAGTDTASHITATDLDGNPRQVRTIDIGAYEYQGSSQVTTYYLDSDGDGYGDLNNKVRACTAPQGYVTDSTDCNDHDSTATLPTTWYLDADGDHYYSASIYTCSRPGAGWVRSGVLGDDCDDNDSTVYNGAPELCDGKDNNCNGVVDEGCSLLTMRINDATVWEGNSGRKKMQFKVMLSAVADRTVTVLYTTVDNTAKAPGDYIATNGMLTFSKGTKVKYITVMIKGDKQKEGDETFKLQLSGVVNALLKDSVGKGTIRNDDGQHLDANTSASLLASKDEKITSDNTRTVAVAPNPANNIVTINLNGFSGNTTLQLLSLQGKVLTIRKAQGNISTQQLDVTDIASGTYFLTITDEQGHRETVKLIVVH